MCPPPRAGARVQPNRRTSVGRDVKTTHLARSSDWPKSGMHTSLRFKLGAVFNTVSTMESEPFTPSFNQFMKSHW